MSTIHTEPGPVHLAVPNRRTGMIGQFGTPLGDISTVCREQWQEQPNRTLRLDLATCTECLARLQTWHERMNEYYERHPAARPSGVKT